jgi:hypothetical protein
MANEPFDRTIINVRERPLSSDINQAESQLDRGLREVCYRLFAHRSGLYQDWLGTMTAGFVGDSFLVSADGSTMNVYLSAGVGFQYNAADAASSIGGVVGLDDLSPLKPLLLAAQKTVAVPASDPVNERIDIVEVKYNRASGNPLSRDVLNTGTGAFVSTLVNKTLTFALDNAGVSYDGTAPINYKVGTPAGSPVAPSVTAGYVKIAEVRVPAASAAVFPNRVSDYRQLAVPDGVVRASMRFSLTVATGAIDTSDVLIAAPPGVKMAVMQGTFGAMNAGIVYVWGGRLWNTPMGMPILNVSLDSSNWQPVGGLNPQNPNLPLVASTYVDVATAVLADYTALVGSGIPQHSGGGGPVLSVGQKFARLTIAPGWLTGGVITQPANNAVRVHVNFTYPTE